MSSDDRLTILLGLRDRTAYTERWMAYAEHVHLPFNVFIADGSSDDRTQQLLGRGRFPHVRYEYVRYPPDTGYSDYWRKIADAAARISTPYVVIADNDDLFVTGGVQDAVAFMDGHPDYATCGGQCAVFWVGGTSPISGDLALYGDHVDWKCSLDASSLEEESAQARIRSQSLRATHPAYYHVRRTDGFRRHAAIVRDLQLADPFLIERLLFFLAAIEGRTRQSACLYLARQWNAPGSSGAVYHAQHGDWVGRMLVPTWSEDFSKFLDAASAALAEHDGLPLDESRKVVVELYRLWTAPQMLGDILTEPTVTMRQIARAVSRRTPRTAAPS